MILYTTTKFIGLEDTVENKCGYLLHLIDNELYKKHETCFINGGPSLHCPYFRRLHAILSKYMNSLSYKPISYMGLFVESLTVL